MCNCNTNRSKTDQIETLNKFILQEVRNGVTYNNTASFELIKDVLRVAAVVNANTKMHHENALFRLPTYQNIHPYRLLLKRKGEFKKFVDFGSHLPTQLNFQLSFNEAQAILEESTRELETRQVAKYKFTMPMKYRERKISLSLNEDGNLVAQTTPENELYVDVTKSIIGRTLPIILNNIGPLLSKMDQKFAIQFPLLDQTKTTEEMTSTSSTVATNCQEIEDLKKSLATLIANVQQQLNHSSSTTDAVKENIRAKVRKCELMINESDVKLKQLQIEKNNLERASTLIKL